MTTETEYTKKPRIYICGPMTGYPNYNYPMFHVMERWLTQLDTYHVVNPARIDDDLLASNPDTPLGSRPRSFYIRESFKMLLTCDEIVLLPEWEKSAGARLEFAISKELGLKMWLSNCVGDDRMVFSPYSPPENSDILDRARVLVNSDRRSQYGHPRDNFTDVGRIWGTILHMDDIAPETVGLMMVGLKVAREAFKHQPDNLLDGIGYFAAIDTIYSDK